MMRPKRRQIWRVGRRLEICDPSQMEAVSWSYAPFPYREFKALDTMGCIDEWEGAQRCPLGWRFLHFSIDMQSLIHPCAIN